MESHIEMDYELEICRPGNSGTEVHLGFHSIHRQTIASYSRMLTLSI